MKSFVLESMSTSVKNSGSFVPVSNRRRETTELIQAVGWRYIVEGTDQRSSRKWSEGAGEGEGTNEQEQARQKRSRDPIVTY